MPEPHSAFAAPFTGCTGADSPPGTGESRQDDREYPLARRQAAALLAIIDGGSEGRSPPLDELRQSGGLTEFQCEATRRGEAAQLVLGNYVLLDRIGRGGMGQVYRAWHRNMERVVALKTLRPKAIHSDNAVRRFHREVKTAARLSHPNIVTAFDADESGGTHFLVMEYVPGCNLAVYVREHGPANVAQATGWLLQAARGLAFAHRRGVVHRDIKPSNLLLGAGGTVKVLDLGLARLEDRLNSEDAAEGLTRTGDLLGTLDFMAPEQMLDTRGAGPKADIYALGCTLYYLLSGEPPYGGRTVSEKLLRHRQQPVPPIRALHPDAPPALDRLLQRMLAKRPEDRPADMDEVVAALEPLAESPDSAADSADLHRMETHRNRLPERLAAMAAACTRSRRCMPGTLATVLIAVAAFIAGMVAVRAPKPGGPAATGAASPRTVSPTTNDGEKPSGAVEPRPLRNVALGPNGAAATAISTGIYRGTVHWPALAIDGDRQTGWASHWSMPAWLQVEFDREYEIERVAVAWGSLHHTFSISLSRDGENWTTVVPSRASAQESHYVDGQYVGGEHAYEAFSIDATPARFIRIDITSTTAPPGHIFQARVFELEAYAR